MSRIPEPIIDEIRNRVDIVDFVGRHVELKRAGRSHKGLCPFHNEKTPSFNVNSDRQMFHCFGCQLGGDVFRFAMERENLSFPEAVRILARECGIEIPEVASGDRSEVERVYAANEIAELLYRRALSAPEGSEGRDYLLKRGLDSVAVDRFHIGFAPDSWDSVSRELAREKIPAEIGARAGLLAPRRSGDGHYDRMRARLIFPISDVRGRVIGFGGRALRDDQEPKYLNTPESSVFHKRDALYGFPAALEAVRKAERAIVCEGYFDRIALDRAGLSEALATCGTALTREHARQLRRRTRRVVLIFDGDAAGRKAVARSLEVLLPEGLRVQAAELPPGEDPDSYLVQHGAEALCALIDEAADAIDWVVRDALADGCSTPVEKSDAVGRVAPLVALVEDPVERVEYARRLAVATGTQVDAVDAVVRSVARGAGGADADLAADLEAVAPRRDTTDDRQFTLLATLLLRYPELSNADSRVEIASVLPEGPWRELLSVLLDAALGGLRSGSGELDPLRIAEQLEGEAQILFRRVATDEAPLEDDAIPERVLDDLLRWFSRQRLSSERRDVTDRLRDPRADVDALLAEKQRQLEERRAARRGGEVTSP